MKEETFKFIKIVLYVNVYQKTSKKINDKLEENVVPHVTEKNITHPNI